MTRARSFWVLFAAVTLVTVPVVSATWGAKGTVEPDTSMDQTSGRMTLDRDTSPDQAVNKVYFNGFHGDYSGSTNANSGVLGTSLYHGVTYSFYAMLGVWKDCNNDGYVGLGDQGQWTYRAELLSVGALAGGPGTSICPPTTPTGTGMPPHNDGTWIHEWISIAWQPWNRPDPNPFDINDNESRVWGDYGMLSLDQEPFGNCWILPHPRNTYAGTGWFLENMDSCWTSHKATDSWDGAVALAHGDTLGAGQLSFSDHPNDQHNSASKLNVANPWGKESDGSDVTVWNCAAPQLVGLSDPTGGMLHDPAGTGNNLTTNDGYFAYVNVSAPGTPGASTTGSPAGTANATASGTDQCSRRNVEGGGRGGAVANEPYALEGDVTQSNNRTQPFFDLAPVTNAHPYLISQKVGTQYVNSTAWNDIMGPDAPNPIDANRRADSGVGISSTDGFWVDAVAGHLLEPNFFDWHLAATFAWYNTYYAYVSPAAVSTYHLTLPGTGTSVYGAEACGSFTTGAHNLAYPTSQLWDCDVSHWWTDGLGQYTPLCSAVLGPDQAGRVCHGGATGMPFGSSVGAPYNLRDIDCFDQNAGPTRAAGVGADAATSDKCSRPS